MSSNLINYNKKEVVEFLVENGLDEIYSSNPQNSNSKSTSVEEVVSKIPKIHNKPINPISSTSQALSALAKKTQQNNNLNFSTSHKSSDYDEKFLSLNEIINQAEKDAKNCSNLIDLRKAVESFEGCNLKKMATNTVFGDGNPHSKVMVVGEAPGNNEDLQGIPFCGDSGEMLSAMFSAVNLNRSENYYITNVIFWRPPGNRRPTEEELAICRPFVERHIQIINPKIIVLVGATAMNALLGIYDPISKIRGQILEYSPQFLSNPIKSFTIFHPSFLMRQPGKKKVAWQDMLTLESALGSL